MFPGESAFRNTLSKRFYPYSQFRSMGSLPFLPASQASLPRALAGARARAACASPRPPANARTHVSVPLYRARTQSDSQLHVRPSPVPMCPQVCQCEPAGRVDEPRSLSSAGVDQTMMLSCLIWSCSVAMPPICAWPPVDRAVCMFVSVCVRSLSPQHMPHSRQECSRVACSLGLKQRRKFAYHSRSARLCRFHGRLISEKRRD